MENRIKMDDLGVSLVLETPILKDPFWINGRQWTFQRKDFFGYVQGGPKNQLYVCYDSTYRGEITRVTKL